MTSRALIVLMHIDSKIIRFYSFFMQVISLLIEKLVPSLARAIEDNELEYNFLIIFRYLNLVKNPWIML
jgi:hypothetical protein